jgi:formyl-CoA transferase
VQTSLLQAQIFMLDFQAARYLIRGEVARQAGNNHPTSIPTGVFKTADGHINIASTGQKIWQRLCRAIGADDLLAHPDYDTAAKRSIHRDALNAEIDRRLARHGSREWIETFNAVGVPCGPIYSIDKVFADPQVAHLGIAQRVQNGGRGDNTLTVLGQPVTLSRTPSAIVAPPPELGEHSEEVLVEFGFTRDEIDDLRRAKAI